MFLIGSCVDGDGLWFFYCGLRSVGWCLCCLMGFGLWALDGFLTVGCWLWAVDWVFDCGRVVLGGRLGL